MPNFTLQQLENILGTPIILASFTRRSDGHVVELTIESLPLAAQTAILNWINTHAPEVTQ